MQTNYHTQHSPFGAFASFTIGLHNAPGGFGQSLSGPAKQNHYVGFHKGGQWQLLPFFEPAKSMVENFVAGSENAKKPAEVHVLEANEFDRSLGWASDAWTSGPFAYSLHSPFAQVPDPETCSESQARFSSAPILFAKLEYDNTNGKEEVQLIFGLSNPDRPWHPVQDTEPDLTGFAAGGQYGFAVRAGEQHEARQCFNVLEPQFADQQGFHRIAPECALIFTIPAGQRREVVIGLGFFEGGIITGGIPSRYWYARYFASLEEVLRYGLSKIKDYLEISAQRDAELHSSRLNVHQQFLLAQATHSYYGSTQLLEHDGKPIWNVNEGEYRMINTFDLTVDHLFYELRWHPWAVRNALELFASRFSYTDTVHSPDGRHGPGGISFTHDMGVMNQFTPVGRSSYECYGLSGCFSQMTGEQLVNWVCCALTYAAAADDGSTWLRGKIKLLLDCAQSLRNRDDPDPTQRNGILKWDSDRCGEGAEITTYDSLDISLGQARNNLYLAVKTWAAWVLLEKAFQMLELASDAQSAKATADLAAASIVSRFETETGMFPAVFEGGNRSRIIPAVEGLVFSVYLKHQDILDRNGRFSTMLNRMETHLKNVLTPGICLDATTGGWKLSSTSTNTWMSKIALCQHVARQLFPAALSDEAITADAVHADWQSRPGCGANAMCDQIESTTGRAVGSRYYPRIVSAILWMSEG